MKKHWEKLGIVSTLLLSVTQAQAVTNRVGSINELDGIGMQHVGESTDSFSRGFITHRHFLYGHLGAPVDHTTIYVGGEAYVVKSSQWLSSPESVSGNVGFGIAELDRDISLADFNPLSIAISNGLYSRFEGLTVMVMGQNGLEYGLQMAESNTYQRTSPPYEPGQVGPIFIPVVSAINPYLNDRFLFTNVSDPLTSKIEGGDSNSPLLVQTESGLAILGTALGYQVFSGTSLTDANQADINIYNLAEHYLPGIQSYLDARNLALNSDYTVNVVVVPETSTFVMVAMVFSCALVRRNRTLA